MRNRHQSPQWNKCDSGTWCKPPGNPSRRRKRLLFLALCSFLRTHSFDELKEALQLAKNLIFEKPDIIGRLCLSNRGVLGWSWPPEIWFLVARNSEPCMVGSQRCEWWSTGHFHDTILAFCGEDFACLLISHIAW